MIQISKKINNRSINLVNLKTTFLLILSMSTTSIKAQSSITGLVSDYNSYWLSTGTSISAIKPNSLHNLLAYQNGGTWYSTGVDDAALNTNGLSYVPVVYEALTPLGATANRVGQGALDDGNSVSMTSPIYPAPSSGASFDVLEYLTDGTQGLGLSTFANNVGGTYDFVILSIDPTKIGDGILDILYFNMALPGSLSSISTMELYDGSGNQIGVTVSTSILEHGQIATVNNDRWDLPSSGPQAIGAQQPVYAFGVELSSFAIPPASVGNVSILKVDLHNVSDPPFIAYQPGALILLAVELNRFDAIPNGRTVDLEWETYSEHNNDFFTLEKSQTGESWEVLREVQGVGNSTGLNNYKINDSDPFSGISYYRLSQTDFDGTRNILSTKSVNLATELELQLIPNPARDFVNIHFEEKNNVTIVMTNELGEVVFEKSPKHSNVISVDLSKFDAGVYFVAIKTVSTSKVQKLIVY